MEVILNLIQDPPNQTPTPISTLADRFVYITNQTSFVQPYRHVNSRQSAF